jgi:hypothetical protein
MADLRHGKLPPISFRNLMSITPESGCPDLPGFLKSMRNDETRDTLFEKFPNW